MSHKLLSSISDSYYLVSLVDNEFPKETCLFALVNDMLQLRSQPSDNVELVMWKMF